MTTKLHLNYSQGLLEVEGSEEFVERIFAEFKGFFLEKKPPIPNKPAEISQVADNEKAGSISNSQKSKKSKTTTSNPSKETLSLVNDFWTGQSGKDFITRSKEYDLPKSHEKLVVYLVYIMQKVNVTDITLNHVFTAYRLLSLKTPTSIRDVIKNAKNRSGMLIVDDSGHIRTHHKGDELVEL